MDSGRAPAGTAISRGARDRALIVRVWREYMRKHWRLLCLIAPVILIGGATAGGYVAVVRSAGEALSEGDSRLIYQIPAWIIGVTFLRAAAMYAQTVLMSDLGARILRDFQADMFQAILRADFARIQGEASGGLVSRFLNDIGVISNSIVRTASSLFRDLIALISITGVMLFHDPVLAIGVAALLGISIGPLQQIAKRARRQTLAAQQQVGAMTSVLVESLAGARMVRTYGLERYEAGRAQAAFEARRKLEMKLSYNRARSDPLLEVLGGLAAAAVFVFVGWRVLSGDSALEDLLTLIAALAMASTAARGLATYNTALNEGLAAVERVFGLVDERPTIVERVGSAVFAPKGGRITFDAVSFRYGQGEPALHEFSLDIAPGERVALVGPSGAGKSTVLNLIPRLYDVSAGAVRIDGQDVRDVTLGSLRAHVAVVSQDTTLFNDTIRANIAFGRMDATEDEIVAAAKAAAAHDFIMELPDGYGGGCGERGESLSGGQRQRIALARAFLRNAPILLLDEATSALDAESEAQVQDALQRLTRGRTTLVIAHRLSTVRECDRIVVMDRGRIAAIGAHEELVAAGGLYARLAALQFQDGAAA